jgi:long-chain fatty acid transport protein
MAGAGSALPQDAMIVAVDPAGLAWVGRRLDVDLGLFNPMRQYTAGPSVGGESFEPGTVHSDVEYFLVPSFALNWPQKDGGAIGLASYVNGGLMTSYRSDANYGLGTFFGGSAGIDMEQLYNAVTYARKIGHSFSLGVSGLFVVQDFTAKGLGALASYVPHSAPYNLTDNGQSLSTGFGYRVGAHVRVTPTVSLAAAYQPRLRMSKFHLYSDLLADHGGMDVPENYTVGASIHTSRTSDLCLDVRQINYSDVPALGNPASDIVNGLGSTDGPGFGWRDMTVYKVGYQWQASKIWTARCGISYGRQPIPGGQAFLNILSPAVQQWHFAVGGSKKITPDSEFSFSLFYSPVAKVSGVNMFATGQTISIEMHQVEAEIGYSRKF